MAPGSATPLTRPQLTRAQRRPHRPRWRGRWRTRLAGLAGTAVLVLGGTLLGPAPSAHAEVPLERVDDFGSNPGGLNMYVYEPEGLPERAPLVVALHGCTQDAQLYADNSGLTELADREGFLVAFAETTSANNVQQCFNWFQPGDTRPGQGEAESIRQMAEHATASYGTDEKRAHITGLSAGGAMTSVMLAAHPDTFRAGAAIAGVPYGCASDVGSAYTCMSPGVDQSPQEWAERVREANPDHEGPWPRVAIWQGDEDTTVVPGNAQELREQWTELHGLSQDPDRTSTIGPNETRHEEHLAGDGSVAVEVNQVPGIGHGTPVEPGEGEQQCGAAGTEHFIESICSSYWITGFFGLHGGAGS